MGNDGGQQSKGEGEDARWHPGVQQGRYQGAEVGS